MIEIFLHIGVHKTGSTSIQDFLYQNTDYLISKRVFAAQPHLLFPKTELEEVDQFDEVLVSRSRDNFRKVLDACTKRKCTKLIISWENFSGKPEMGYSNAGIIAEMLSSVLNGHDVKVIAYLPRQDQLVESWYVQMVKKGESRNFDEFLLTHQFFFDWPALLKSYGLYFGKENVIAKIFDRRVFSEPEDLVHDFLSVVGVEPPADHQVRARSNPGLQPVAVEFSRFMTHN